MEIDINQRKISIGAEYNIHLDGKGAFNARKELFTILSEINLFNKTQGKSRYQLNQKWAWFKTSYDLIRYDNNIFQFRTKNLWKLHYECQVAGDLYEIFGHRGRKHSIYRNDKQIAWWDKEAVSWFSGDNYRLIADNDSDIELLISFCLIMDNVKSQNKKGNTVTVDLGHIGFQAKEFNPNWRPKI
ncbi:hypothetical protein [uncultured Arcticibacterium sp.]|uniref:hypothetical protein n=1 Tax=uncultured Arcticibacterium sp. TaxID=2173042 RepID=UPI0030F63785